MDINQRALGIENVDTNRRASLARVPVGSKSTPETPGAYDPLLSPPIHLDGRHLGGKGSPYDDDRDTIGHNQSNPSMFQSYTADSEHERLHQGGLSTGGPIYPSGSYF